MVQPGWVGNHCLTGWKVSSVLSGASSSRHPHLLPVPGVFCVLRAVFDGCAAPVMVPPSICPTAVSSIALAPVPLQSSESGWAAVPLSDLSSLQSETGTRALPASSVTGQLSITALHIAQSMVVSAELKRSPCPLSPFPQGRKYFFLPRCWMESLLLMCKMKCHFHKPPFFSRKYLSVSELSLAGLSFIFGFSLVLCFLFSSSRL